MDQQSLQAAEVLYRSLTTFFASHIDSIAELEILPSSYPLPISSEPVLQDSNCLAIRKRDLVAAYMVARRSFFRRKFLPEVEDSILLDTSVLIFFAPEHLAAVNWRKRLLKRKVGEAADDSSKEAGRLLHRELCMLDTFCTSPLPKHTKSPTLWQHRYWVVSTFMGRVPGWMPTFVDELQVVLQAADKHFANYTAFDYARRLWMLLLRANTTQASGKASVSEGNPDRTKAAQSVQKFCFAHPRDISGWSFLAFLIRGQSALIQATEEATRALIRDTGCSSKAIDCFLQMIIAPSR